MRRTSVLPQAKPRRRDGSAIPSISITEGRSGPSAREAQKERHAISVPFFLAKHYNPDISNFRFAILRSCPTALLGRAAFAAYERFAGGKTSAEGWLSHPEHLNHRRAERALGPRSPKRKTRYKRAFLFGKALQSRYFKFSICHLEILPNGPSGPRRFCGVRAFCRRQNLGGGMAQPSRAFQSPKGGVGPRPAKPKKKDTL